MLLILAFRHLWVRKVRSLFLLFGFAIGVGVMVVLLSVGEAMLDQSRDVSLVGGGEVTILPQGIDIEAMRTGGAGGMFFSIERAPFLTRQALGGKRHAGVVRAVSPAIEGKLVYICKTTGGGQCRPTAVRAGGEIPSRAAAVGAGLDVLQGRWADSPADSGYIAPSRQRLYDELDRFHVPRRPDSTWAEWQYYNVVVAPDEWWYVTYLVGGAVPTGRWGGRVLITRRRPDGRYERFTAEVPGSPEMFDTMKADLTLGPSTVRQRDGVYALHALARGEAGLATIDLAVRPAPERYFPAVELREEALLSGYVVPALAGSATGTVCVAGRCRSLRDALAYHDHNWGVWRDVTWEWGAARGASLALLYGGVYTGEDAGSPFFLSLVDSLGVRQILRFNTIHYQGSIPAAGLLGAVAPREFELHAARLDDTVRLHVDVSDAVASRAGLGGGPRDFVQMRGRFRVEGKVSGTAIADTGSGFFETYLRR
ncbi:MAG TPA: ABC transporter permease [Gemmatimonadales bacterium]|jgi:hypothetical protein